MNIGIDLGGSHISIGLIQNNKIIEKKEKRIMAKEKREIKNVIESFIIENIKGLKNKYEIEKIGIAVPGTVIDNIIVQCVNLGVEKYNLAENLSELELPIIIINDAKAAALAEYKYGILKDYNRSIFLTLGTGIGGAAIIDGKLLNTGSLPGCEFGHMIIQNDGIKCNCGKSGCFEKYASMKSLKDNIIKILNLDEDTSGEEILNIIKNDTQNEKIKDEIDKFIEYLSIGISNLINIFEPEAIAIGGSFVHFSDILLEKLKNNMQDKKMLFNKREKLLIFPANLKNDAGILGSCI